MTYKEKKFIAFFFLQIINVPWYPGEPNNLNNRQHCVNVNNKPNLRVFLFDQWCSFTRYFVCEFSLGKLLLVIRYYFLKNIILSFQHFSKKPLNLFKSKYIAKKFVIVFLKFYIFFKSPTTALFFFEVKFLSIEA